MKDTVISVTQAARRFADCVNRVHYQGASFLLEKNGVPVARIVPVESASDARLERPAAVHREARKEEALDERAAHRSAASGSGEPSGTPHRESVLRRPPLNW